MPKNDKLSQTNLCTAPLSINELASAMGEARCHFAPPTRGWGWGYGSKSSPKLFSMKICWLLMRVSCGAGTIGK
jgi:hypothetical protein